MNLTRAETRDYIQNPNTENWVVKGASPGKVHSSSNAAI